MISPEKLWADVSERLRPQLNDQTFSTWFEPINAVSVSGSTVTLEVPSRFYYEWIDSHYRSLILDKLREATDRDFELRYSIVVGDGGAASTVEELSRTSQGPNVGQEYYDRGTKLNKRYTFDRFVEGPNNQLAKAGAMSVAESPGQTSFNPLLVYGGVGLGKTHLLQAIGNHALGKNGGRAVHYTTSEKFTLDFISAIQNNKTSDFSRRYRQAGLLLMDDVQFLQKKEQTQEQFFHTFNEIYQQGRQIVLTSDRHPRELHGLKDRLISRFQSGLIVDIQAPNLETRIAILQRKAEEDGLDIPYEITEFIATNIRSNIREMEGALIKLLAYSSLSHADVSLDLARRALRETLGKSADYGITIDDVIRGVSSVTNIPENRLIGKGRKMEVSHARQIAMYLCRELVGASLENIGLHFGGRDHTTVIHACRTVQTRLKIDPTFKRKMDGIRMKLAA